MNESRAVRFSRWAAAFVGAAFGLTTVYAGGSVLLGRDPGYLVFPPLVIYNTAMGFAYLAVGVAIWRRPRLGLVGARAIFLLNVAMLIAIVGWYSVGGGVANDSLQAMSFRTAVWMALYLAVSWLVPRSTGE